MSDAPASLNMIRTGPRGGAPLLFLHALGLDLSVWDHQIQALARDHDVIAIDLPGHGLSPRSEHPPTLAAFAQALSELITTLRAGPADVVGISVGGMIAQAWQPPHRSRCAPSRWSPPPARSPIRSGTSCASARTRHARLA
jgi:pimeloyl-ACP methyl ester carboxylesterase